MVQRPGRAWEGLPLCAPGEGPDEPGGALPSPERREAAPVARWERWPDTGQGDAESRCVARGRMALREPIPRAGLGGQVCMGRPRAPSPPSSG